MPGLEDALISSAGGDFGLMLLAFLIIVLVGCFIWAIRKILDQNAAFNLAILKRFDEIVAGIKDYNTDTSNKIERACEEQTKVKMEIAKIQTTLDNRPCIAGK